MAYTKTQWVNNEEPSINAENLNKMEQGIYDAQFPDEGDEGQVLTKTASGQAWGTLSATNVETSSDVAIKSVSGNPVTIADALQGKALGVNTTLEPIQDLHGYDHPWAGGAGKNKLKVNTTSVTRGGITFTVNDDGSVKIEGTTNSSNVFINMNYVANTLGIPVGTWKIGLLSDDPRISIRGYVTANSVETRAEAFGMDFETVTVPNDATQSHVRVQISITGITINTTVYPMILSGDETDTSWAPYSNICPISGRTQVDVNRTGKNLLDNTLCTPRTTGGVTRIINSDGTITLNGTSTGASIWWRSADNMNVPFKAGTYVVSVQPSDDLQIQLLFKNAGSKWNEFTLNEDDVLTNVRYLITIGTVFNNVVTKPMIRLASETDATFEPYNRQTVTVQLGQTVYGGTLDVTNGELTVEKEYVDLGTLKWSKNSSNRSVFQASIDSKETGMDNIVCSNYITVNSSSVGLIPNGAIRGHATNKAVYIHDDTYASIWDNGDVADFKTAMNGVQLCYELATPQTIQLTPAQVSLLTGTNIITTNADDLSVMYYATGKGDVEGSLSFLLEKTVRNETSINSLAGSLAMVETSPATTNHAVGDLIVYNNQLYEVTVAIATGETLTVGTNISATKMGDQLSELSDGFHKFGASSPSGLTITVPNSYRGIVFFTDSSAQRCGQIILFSNGSGSVSYATVLAPGDITLKTGTNSLIVIPTAGTRRLFAIDVAGTLTI